MVDVDNFTDAELRTKLLEFGFPVMPITGTTRKVMTKKLKLLLETKNKANSSDGRRSLGRYSSEEDSDTDVKSVKNQKNRRATMAAPVSSTTKTTRKVIVEPEVVSSSPRATTKTSTTRTSKIVKLAQDDFDTGSDSESDIVASSNKYESASKEEDLFQDVEFNKRSSPIKSSLSSSYSRYSPKSPSDLSYSSVKNVSFSATSSPARHTTYVPDTVGLSESLASSYAADRLNQIRSRLSLGSPNSYDKPSYSVASPEVKITDRDTPFLSNFTRRLSALSASKKGDLDKNDLVKEHDSNGLYGKSYLSSFRANRGREPTYDYKTRQGSGGKNNLVSYAVLVVAATFFVILGVVYLGMVTDTSVITSGKTDSNPYATKP